MMQTKKSSFIEACINTIIGFLVAWIANPLFCWLFHIKMNSQQMTSYVIAFTVLSIIRGYIVRRFFNKMIHNAAIKIAHDSP